MNDRWLNENSKAISSPPIAIYFYKITTGGVEISSKYLNPVFSTPAVK
jgi:hypothetical protein